MLESATPVGAQPNTSYGYGYVDIAGAFAKLKSDYAYLAAPSLVTTKTLYSASKLSIDWTAVAGRDVRYSVTQDGVLATTTADTSVALSGLADGVHVVRVTPTSVYNWYDAGRGVQMTFSVDTVAPAAPVVSFDASNRRVLWTDSEQGTHVTEFALDSTASPSAVTGTAFDLAPDASAGSRVAYVRMIDAAGNAGPWGSVSFRIIGVVSVTGSSVTLVAPVAPLAWGASEALSGGLSDTQGLPMDGSTVEIQSSLDGGASWAAVSSAITDASGVWRTTVTPGRNVMLRAHFAGDAAHAEAVSNLASVRQLVSLGTPITPGSIYHGRSFATYGYLKPRHTPGSTPVRLSFYRYERQSTGSQRWMLRKAVLARAYDYASYTRYSVSTSLPYAGQWRVIASYAGTTDYAATGSGPRSFIAK
jgi:hypothetical protein